MTRNSQTVRVRRLKWEDMPGGSFSETGSYQCDW